MNTRRTTLIVAVVLAIITGWLALNYLSSLQRSSVANNQPREILVAAQEIPPRVPITPNMLAKASRPAAMLDPDTVSDPSKVIGALSLITIPAGSTITASKIGRPSDVGLPVRLAPGMRAMSIQIDKVKGISGLIQPGDRVDIVAVPPKSGDVPPPASTILRGIRVLSVGEVLETASATPSPQEQVSTTVTLEVTPKQADLLAMADLNSTLRLALRSPREPLNSYPTEAMHFGGTTIGGPAPGPQVASTPDPLEQALALRALDQQQPPGVARPAPRPDNSWQGVTIIDGDHYVTSGSP